MINFQTLDMLLKLCRTIGSQNDKVRFYQFYRCYSVCTMYKFPYLLNHLNSVHFRHLKVKQNQTDRHKNLICHIGALFSFIHCCHVNLNCFIQSLFTIIAKFTSLNLIQLIHLIFNNFDINHLVINNNNLCLILPRILNGLTHFNRVLIILQNLFKQFWLH